MKAFIIDSYKPSDGGRIADVREPVPGDGQGLVKIDAAGLRPVDSRIRSGRSLNSFCPTGCHLTGAATSPARSFWRPGSRRFDVGDEVYAHPDESAIGTFAELIAINGADVARQAEITLHGASSLHIPLALCSTRPGRHSSNERTYNTDRRSSIEAGSGGVRHVRRIEREHSAGDTVATTTSVPPNVELVEDLCADIVIDYKTHETSRQPLTRSWMFASHSQDATTPTSRCESSSTRWAADLHLRST